MISYVESWGELHTQIELRGELGSKSKLFHSVHRNGGRFNFRGLNGRKWTLLEHAPEHIAAKG